MQKSRLLFLCFLFLQTLAYSQKGNYVIKQYTSENGLPQNSVKAIKFDKSGFCWLATESGIVRFDNNNFKPYGSDIVKGLKSERIVAMMTDTAGTILAQGLDFQNIKIGSSSSQYSFLPVLTDTNISFVTTGYLTQSLALDSLWQSIYDTKTIPAVKEPGGLKNGDIYLFLGEDAWFIRKSGPMKLKPFASEPTGSMVINDNYFLQIWPGNKITCWNNGIGQAGQIDGELAGNKNFLRGEFKALWCEQGSFIYAGGNVYELSYKNGKVSSRLVISNLNLEMPLCIAYRPDLNTYYIGTGTQGLFTIKISDFIYSNIPPESGPENYYTVGKTSNDDIIVINAIVHPDNTSFHVPLLNNHSRAMYTDSEDRVYYESEFQLFRYNSKTRTLDKNILQLDNRAMAIIPVVEDNTLLLCTHSTLYKTTLEGKIIWQKKLPEGTTATALLPLRNEEYLLATSEGVKWYDLKDQKITRSILDSFNIRNVYQDNQNRLWIGTDGKGSYLFSNNKVYSLSSGPRGAFSSIHSFIEDKNGNFWLPTNNGLYKVAVNELADFATGKSKSFFSSAFNNTNGLRTNEFNGGAHPNFQWLKDSALLLPSINGLIKFYPNRLTADFPQEKIYIDEISIDGQPVVLSKINESIELKPTFQALNIRIACPFFGNKENLKLEYNIGNDIDQWIPVPSSGIISINTLPAGDYKLMFRKAGSNKDTPNASIAINIIVSPFFYQTGWFLAGIVLLMASLGYLYSRRRLAKLEKEKLKIEKIVELRTEELNAAIVQLENSEIALKQSNHVKEQIVATVLHDIKSPLFSMRMAGKSLVKNWNKSNDENLDQVIGLNQLIGELSRFTDQFFSWAASQQEHFKVTKTKFSLQQIFGDIEALFKEILQVNNNRFSIPETDIQCFTDKEILVLILRNLVDNANKNTENGIISIQAAFKPEGLQIQVSDTGKGLNAFQIENFLNRDKAVKNGRMGSVIILEMLDKIDGALQVNSEQGKGAVFTITLRENKS
ncbi:sensor histidine kinase [Pseudobacter ginsenosidimutans]|uniref:Signal transduction histidine kinase n=1 Tax=Pseudobacter ginsenosidimutans TaxID=661488 RepID=A0A4Q7MRI9_9BACT|nr:two-component regulator propeller domain-containing protein [Pseudobacter ginsenosidimutans]RZS71038.1 signal transduction histidine kinase [Pseudobacter ginsenosidimutans]